jgi:hypothetical protein
MVAMRERSRPDSAQLLGMDPEHDRVFNSRSSSRPKDLLDTQAGDCAGDDELLDLGRAFEDRVGQALGVFMVLLMIDSACDQS